MSTPKPEPTGDIHFRRALPEDAAAVAALVNLCYRGEASRQGWTTEADLLTGARTDCSEVSALIAGDTSMILLALTGDEIIGSVCIERQGEQAHLGMFVVKPNLQALGIGKRLLDYAERTAQQQWAVQRMMIAVIHCRNELIAWYERRGYQRTGHSRAFPLNPALWQPLVDELRLLILEKPLDPG